MNYKHLFGPVPSRRLGVSLGVDIVSFKYCSMNCIYCEIGRTTNLTMIRDEYVPFEEVKNELRDYLSSNPELDYITFSGAGEPTLNSRVGDVISFIKRDYPKYKIALITNSTLLPDAQLRKEIKPIDLILPSLDAVSQDVFQIINRPCLELNTAEIIEGLIAFRQESQAEMWLEIFFLPGINDHESELSLLKGAVQKINPHRVQLNSLDRPGTERWLVKEPQENLDRIAQFLKPLPVEIISRKTVDLVFPEIDQQLEDKLISTVSRRPCTAEDLAKILHLHIDELAKFLSYLHKKGTITAQEQETGVFYSINKKE